MRVAPDSNDICVCNFDDTAGTTFATTGTTPGVFTESGSGIQFKGVPGIWPNTKALRVGASQDPRIDGPTNTWLPNSFTVSAWLRLHSESASGTGSDRIFYVAHTTTWTSPFTVFELGLNNRGRLYTSIKTIGNTAGFTAYQIGPTASSGPYGVPFHVWQHIGATYDSSTGIISVYLDGILMGETNGSSVNNNPLWASTNYWRIGTEVASASTNCWDETITDFRIADIVRPLSWFQSIRASTNR